MKYKIIIAISLLLLVGVLYIYINYRHHEIKSNKLIYSDGFGEIKIGDDYNKVKKYCKRMNFKAIQKGEFDDAGLYIYKDSIVIVLIRNKNYGMPPYFVRMIEFYSEDFKTEDGICVGMKLKDLLNIFPDSKFENGMDDLQIRPKKYNSSSKSDKYYTVFEINMEIKGDEVKNESVEELNKNINNIDAIIESIIIYDWN